VDRNHDGMSDAAELLTMTQAGIWSLALDDREERRIDRYRNIFRYRSRVQGEPHVGPWAWDVLFRVVPPPESY
jgi:hypothetical protein